MPDENSNIISLSNVASDGRLPSSSQLTTVFLHGLDSSSLTWKNIQSDLSTASIAVDLRGCGCSPMGDTEQFTIENVCEDLNALLSKEDKFVLVGHSMGAKIATYYAARHPTKIAALVLEDMDVRRRPTSSNPFPSAIGGFDRSFDTLHDATKALRAVYPLDRIESWIEEGRVRREGKRWWSDVNPEFRRLCYLRFFDNDSAEQAWREVSSTSFPKHLFLAGEEHTVCELGSVRKMRDVVDGLEIIRFGRATHSVHDSMREEYLEKLEVVIKNCHQASS